MIPAAPVTPRILEELAARIRTGQCILFLGAGIHFPPAEDSPYSYPEAHRPTTGSALAKLLARDCDFENIVPHDSKYDLQRVSLCYETTAGLGRTGLVTVLTRDLETGKEPSPLLRMLAALPFKIILTTNYDRLFERALREQGKEVEPLIYDPTPGSAPLDSSDDPSPDRPLLFKIYGDLSRGESIVISEEDHFGFVQRMSELTTNPIPATVRFRMRRWPILLLGCSLRDYNLRLLIRILRWRQDPAFALPFSLVDPCPDPLLIRVWQDQMHSVTFLIQDLWNFTSWLYREIVGDDFPPEDLSEVPK